MCPRIKNNCLVMIQKQFYAVTISSSGVTIIKEGYICSDIKGSLKKVSFLHSPGLIFA
jgi:hypothetical protein